LTFLALVHTEIKQCPKRKRLDSHIWYICFAICEWNYFWRSCECAHQLLNYIRGTFTAIISRTHGANIFIIILLNVLIKSGAILSIYHKICIVILLSCSRLSLEFIQCSSRPQRTFIFSHTKNLYG